MPTLKNEVTGSGLVAILGISKTKHGVVGEAQEDGTGVMGTSIRGDGVAGLSTSGNGVLGRSERAAAIRGLSKSGRGVEGWSDTAEALFGVTDSGNGASGNSKTGYGVVGQSERSSGVRGVSISGRGAEGTSDTSYGVYGESTKAAGVRGISSASRGVEGSSSSDEGVRGSCETGIGVHGVAGRSRLFSDVAHGDSMIVTHAPSPADGYASPWRGAEVDRERALASEAAVESFHATRESDAGRFAIASADALDGPHGFGISPEAEGVSVSGFHNDRAGIGVLGEHRRAGIGVKAVSEDGLGLAAYSTALEAVHAETQSRTHAAIAAFNLNPNGGGAAIYANKAGTRGHAGFFVGNVWVTGELGVGGDVVLANADCAEDFDVMDAAAAEPGTVMVMGEGGLLVPCAREYDKCVAGVISGAGDFRPGVVLDRRETIHARRAVALLGKVYCKATAAGGAIEVGDLLTTSSRPGHAMKAGDAARAFGAVIGKALGPLDDGDGLVPILIALQ